MPKTLSVKRRLLAVFCGGFLGAIMRSLFSTWIQGQLGKVWPYDILMINVTGALLLAFVTTLADAKVGIGPTRRLFINVGFLGAYTTFSSLILGDILLINGGLWWSASSYLLLSVSGGLLAVLLGDLLGYWVIKYLRKLVVPEQLRPLKQEQAIQAASLDATKRRHLDVQDDVLLSEEDDV